MAGKLVLAGRKGLYWFQDGVDPTNYSNGTQLINAADGSFNVTTETVVDLTTTGTTVIGNAVSDTLTVNSTSQLNNTLTVGVNDTGYDVKFFGATASSYCLWDESADALLLAGVARLDLSSCTVNASNTDGGVIKGGTSGSPITEDTANMKFVSFYFDDGATSGEAVGVYDRLYVTGAGGSGTALRSFVTVSDVAAATVHGAQISASFGATGSITGLGDAIYANIFVPGAMTNGTYAVMTAEVYADAAGSSLAGVTDQGFFRVGVAGNASGLATLDGQMNLFNFYGVTAGSGKFINTDKTAGTAYGGIPIKVPGVGTKWLLVVSA